MMNPSYDEDGRVSSSNSPRALPLVALHRPHHLRSDSASSPHLSLVVIQPDNSRLLYLRRVDLGNGVHDTSDTSDGDSGDIAQVGGVAEEEDTRCSDRKPDLSALSPKTHSIIYQGY